MNNTTTTTIRIPLDLFIKIKTEKINLSQLVSKFLQDYFIETEEDFELKELEDELKQIEEELSFKKNEQMKVLSKITKLKQELEEKEIIEDKRRTAEVQSLKANNPLRFM